MTSDARICNNCGNGPIKPQDKFCTSCGADLALANQVQLEETSSANASESGTEDEETPTGPGTEYVEPTAGPRVQIAMALRRLLPGGQRVSIEEREEILKYIRDNSAVISLQTREAGRYNSILSMHMDHLDKPESIDALLEASSRLLLSVDECILRHRALAPVPERALPSYEAWEVTLDAYLDWVRATNDAFLEVLKATTPSSEKVQDLFSEQEKCQIRADMEDLKLRRAVGLNAGDLSRIVNQEGESMESVQWEPDVSSKTLDEQ